MRSLLLVAFLAFAATASASTCKNSFSVLTYGYSDSGLALWFRDNFPNATLTQNLFMNETLTLQYLSRFDLVIITKVTIRLITTAEANAALDYLNQGGAIIGLAGYDNDAFDRQHQQAIFAALNITYGDQLMTLDTTLNYNPNNPLTTGLAGGYVDFIGGWASTPYTGPGTTSLFASGVSIYDFNTYSVGQTIVLPSGGKILTWGDEWASFAERFSMPNNKDSQFWKNIIAWVICSPGFQVGPCVSTKIEVASSCLQTTQSSAGKGFTLAFSSNATAC